MRKVERERTEGVIKREREREGGEEDGEREGGEEGRERECATVLNDGNKVHTQLLPFQEEASDNSY